MRLIGDQEVVGLNPPCVRQHSCMEIYVPPPTTTKGGGRGRVCVGGGGGGGEGGGYIVLGMDPVGVSVKLLVRSVT